jgi:hypothetical protein
MTQEQKKVIINGVVTGFVAFAGCVLKGLTRLEKEKKGKENVKQIQTNNKS